MMHWLAVSEVSELGLRWCSSAFTVSAFPSEAFSRLLEITGGSSVMLSVFDSVLRAKVRDEENVTSAVLDQVLRECAEKMSVLGTA